PARNLETSDYVGRLREKLIAAYCAVGLSPVEAEARAHSAFVRFADAGLKTSMGQNNLDGYLGRKSVELSRAARRFGVDSFTAEDLAQSAVSGFVRWLIDHPLQLENPGSF